MDRKFWASILPQFFGGFVCGAIMGFGVSFGLAGIILRHPSSYFDVAAALSLCVITPACGLALGFHLAKREYRDRLESARLHSHFCKRCGYDLRGSTDIVCPECGTGIPDKQRKQIKKFLETPTE
jgi:hypothetical protein